MEGEGRETAKVVNRGLAGGLLGVVGGQAKGVSR